MDKKKIYEKLGACWFQKVVFKVEDLKFRLIDKFCPNLGDWYSKRCDHKVTKICSKIEDEEEKNKIRFKYNCKKMTFQRELVEKKNRNYHMTCNNASEFYKYLLWNKKVHVNGIIKNLFCITGCGIALAFTSGFWFGAACCYLGYNLLSLGVNFQCVNLQNYNICRFDEKREVLKKMEMRKRESDVKNYALVGEAICKKLESSVEKPKSTDVVASMTSVEELLQLRKLALDVKRQRSVGNVTSKEDVKINVKR